MSRILIAGTNSGCGKTTVTLAVLSALKARGISVSSFKCGPDYIDPMFHKKVLGIPAFNLDPFFLEHEALRTLLVEGAKGSDVSVIEGVMGYYDGVSNSPEGSTYSVAKITETPVILVVACDGIANSIGAVISGYKKYLPDSGIAGVIFNHLPKWRYPDMAEIAKREGLIPLGCLPVSSEYTLGSRHLGLVTAGELENLSAMLDKLGRQAEVTIDIDALLALASMAAPIHVNDLSTSRSADVRIAVSRDEAFCFMYDENIALLKKNGCEIVYFSPLHDKELPQGVGGVWLCGGYPELYAEKLAANKTMLQSIKSGVQAGLPTIAECGGFMYLNETLTDTEGSGHEMSGVVKGEIFPTDRLVRFGYLTITAKKDNLLCAAGGKLRVHEFHYWDSTDCGDGFIAEKATRDAKWDCIHSTETLYAGFPHLYLPAAPDAALSFADKAREYIKRRQA